MPNRKIPISSAIHRGLLGAAAIVLIAVSYFGITWGFANTVARRADAIELSELAVTLSPEDPQAHYSNAIELEKTFHPENIRRALMGYEKAVALSPSNFLYCVALGQARERDGDRTGAENAYRRALALAPNYSRTRWAFGNNLVRQGRIDEGFAEIRAAVESDAAYSAPAVTAAWQAFEGDVAKVDGVLGESHPAKAELAKFLAGSKRYDEAGASWDLIPVEERRTRFRDVGIGLIGKFVEGKRFRLAAKTSGDLAEDAKAAPQTGNIGNGGFEDGVQLQNASFFDWQIGQGVYPQIALISSEPKEGRYSLALLFSTPTNLAFRGVTKTVAVEPGGRYRLSISFRNGVTTKAEFRWEIVSAGDGERLGVTDPLANSSVWSTAEVTFAVPNDADGIIVQLLRDNCNSAACTVSGNIWFDSINLEPATK